MRENNVVMSVAAANTHPTPIPQVKLERGGSSDITKTPPMTQVITAAPLLVRSVSLIIFP